MSTIISNMPKLSTIGIGCLGWMQGNQIGVLRAQEAEIKQGKNYWLVIHIQATEIGLVMSLVSGVSARVFSSFFIRCCAYSFCNVIPLISIPVLSLFAASTHGKYRESATFFNTFLRNKGIHNLFGMLANSVIQLPETISDETAKWMRFLVENVGSMAFLATVVGIAVMAVLGEVMFGIAAVTALGYSWMAYNTNYIPLEVKVFIEDWSPLIQLLGAFLGGGGIVMKILAILIFVASNLNRFHAFLRQLEEWGYSCSDKLLASIPQLSNEAKAQIKSGLKNREFSEATAPLGEVSLSFETMQKILGTDYLSGNQPLLNLSRLAKVQDSSLENLKEQNYDFDQFLDVFAGVLDSERERYPTKIFARAIVKDDRFVGEEIKKERWPQYEVCKIENLNITSILDFQRTYERYPSDLENAVIQEIIDAKTICKLGEGVWTSPEGLIRILADEKQMTSQQYLSYYLKTQLSAFIDGLNNKTPIKTEDQRQIKDARDGFSRILSYLISSTLSIVEKEDLLLRIAVEGGQYCASGLQELKDDLMGSFVVGEEQKNWSPLKQYESKTLTDLQLVREAIAGELARDILTSSAGIAGSQISQDRHAISDMRRAYSFGFVPISEFALNHRYSFSDFILWKLMGSSVRQTYLYPAFLNHLLNESICTEQEKLDFINYMDDKIKSLPDHLYTKDQKHTLLYGDENQGGLEMASLNDNILLKYKMLFYTMLGIIKPPVSVQ